MNKSKSYYDRMDNLHKQGAISDNDWEDAYYNYRTSKQLVKIQQEKIRYLNKEINYNIILAPYDGFISQKLADVGTYAKIGSPVLVLNGSNKTQVEIIADSNIVNSLDINKQIKLERNDITYQGKISHISKTSRKNGGYLIKIDLDNLYSELKDGMSITAFIPDKTTNVALVPLNSVFEKGDETYIYKITNIKNNIGTLEQKKVKTKNIQNEEIEITDGIKEGDIIITKNPNKYYSGEKVKL